ncbi:MAG: copper-binding protein [Burkholderiales bacterium RIFCSPHIGHO2_01_FULL_64_960]|jgi:Cu(I)/Ag(I) efflux system periplasmic protein CusF|nr:MAG: copper-binding protein [Burkholderiales bacterium RIFCSPHIGHO2_01_FULL_64_960]OGB07491.1 MAG: copper-binding protein [Burkholderiales bacterium RIFCSPHIGHO2_02_FULL_64_19]OGB15400.1 MAG: copper-binding protein [Burkholderiales bacterium RIFCSPHIGHO2_12_FULL_65_48]OGB55381.1 MAG: copper-binding protein [Burkholderiales bacterium RIFCSPLOWO2_12_FULL_64_33]
MKKTNTTIATVLLAMAALLPVSTMAQAAGDAAKSSPAAASMTDGEVRKIDKDSSKITIKHGEIKHLEMPGMTMVFNAKDKSLLDKVQVGDKVSFMVVSEGGKMVVTAIEPAK